MPETTVSLGRSTLLLFAALLLQPVAWSADERGGPAADAQAPDAGETGEAVVSVFYATNRRRRDDRPAADTYGGDRGEPHFGRCEVEFTPIPIMDEVARKVPFYVPNETNEISVAEQADPHKFWERLSARVAQTSSESVVVFVHGYNYGFDRNCHMAAELQRTLSGRSTVVVFSWPSNGNPADYVPDQVDVEWSVPFLAQFLAVLSTRFGADNVNVLAHSLGSRGVVYALERLRADLPARPVIGHLVLLAPDFDSQTFVDLLPRLDPLTRSVTLYASSNDTPLKLSRKVNGHPRLGEAGEFLTIGEGMETIDVSGVGRYQILGHEYFYYHPLVVADLVALLTTGKGAAERPALRPKSLDAGGYWELVEPKGL
jgi:esterase/lipase superfamily enzyme